MADLLLQLLAILAGRAERSDLLQDQVGARALLSGGNPYPVLGPAMARLGVVWPLFARSTHPPTAFVLLLPLAPLAWPVVALLWAALQLVALAITAWAYRLSGRLAILLCPLLLWPPILAAFGQFTILWLAGVALAWRFRDRPFVAGMCIGLASLAKLTPAILLLPFLRRRAWGAVAGFAVVWAGALAFILVLDRGAIGAYLSANRGMTPRTIARTDNGALLPYLHQRAGLGGLLLGAVLIAVLGLAAWRRSTGTDWGWPLWSWLAVALLPIAWTYSLVPLLPVLLWSFRHGAWPSRALAVAACLLPFWGAVPSSNPGVVAGCMACAGVARIRGACHRADQGAILGHDAADGACTDL